MLELIVKAGITESIHEIDSFLINLKFVKLSWHNVLGCFKGRKRMLGFIRYIQAGKAVVHM